MFLCAIFVKYSLFRRWIFGNRQGQQIIVKPLIQHSIMIINSCSVQLQMSMVKRPSRGIKAIPQMTPPCGLRAISGQSGAILGQKGKWQERQWTGYWSINGRSICIGSVSRRGDSDEDNVNNCTCNDLCILLVRKEQGVPKLSSWQN